MYLVVMLTGAQEEGSTLYCPGLGDRCVEVGEVSVTSWSHTGTECHVVGR